MSASICTQERSSSASSTRPAPSNSPATCPPSHNPSSRPSNPSRPTCSSDASAFTPGIGSPTPAQNTTSPSPWGTPSASRPSTLPRPSPTPTMPKSSHDCCGEATSHWPTPTHTNDADCGTSSVHDCVSSDNAPNSTDTSTP